MRMIALLILCMFSESAVAQTDCQSIPKAKARLACYDKLSPPVSLANPATPKTPTAEPGQYVDPLAKENARTDKAVKTICRGC
jgi:hypothetical protein